MTRYLILILALSLVIGTRAFCPTYKGKKCGGKQMYTLRGKQFEVTHGSCVPNGDKEECECETGFSGPDCGTHGCSKTLNDCSGADHGACIDPGLELQNPDVLQSAKNSMGDFPTCKCKPAFTGETCAEKTCTPDCKNGGTCLNGFCHCKFGFAGKDCSEPACGTNAEKVKQESCTAADGENKCDYIGLPITGANACSGHGSCKLPAKGKEQNVHCSCNPGFEGVLCEKRKELTNCPSVVEGQKCSGHGDCEPSSTDATKGICVCTSSYKGVDCSEKICLNDCNSAKKQGVCDVRLRSCVCKKGFTGVSCEKKDCGGTIRKRTSTGEKFVVQCSGHGQCAGDLTCNCDDGYKGDDCSEELCPNNCNGERGECKSVGSAPKGCVCKNGYAGSGCAEMSRTFCNDHGEGKDDYCDPVKNKCSTDKVHVEKQSCMCQPGFTGKHCEISACLNTEENHPNKGLKCSGALQGTCLDNKKCKCNPGFVGPKCGRTCPKLDGKVCSDHGECIYDGQNKTQGKCSCAMGWEGEFCEKPACETGKNAQGIVEQCSGKAKGLCVNSKCYCRDGWMQGNCERAVCPGDCNGHGRCNSETSRCHCEHGWTGEGCSEQACCDPNCSGNGKCSNGTCICSDGWYGMSCESRSPHKAGSHNCQKLHYCYKHGECDEAGNKCICEVNQVTNQPMWRGKFCEIPVCHKDCSGPNNGECVYSSNGLKGVCKCKEGWSGDHCQKRGCPHACSSHGYCLNGTCFCHPGFTGDGCERKACPNACSGHGICGDTGLCVCVNGYSGVSCNEKPCPGFSVEHGACSGHGTCDDGTCKCVGFHQRPFNDEPMWVGVDCSEQTCPSGKYDESGNTLVKNACSGKGLCSTTNNTKSECLCDEGFGGEGCELRTCKGWGKHLGNNKFQFKKEKCLGRGTCVEKAGHLPKCECIKGYEGDSCESHSCDWDLEKKVALPNCYSDAQPTPHGVCTNGTCYCHTNFTGPHCELAACKKCTELQKCENECSKKGVCENGKCKCDAGRHGSDCSLKEVADGSTLKFKAISALVHPVHGKPCESSCRSQCGSKTHLDKTKARSCIWSCENKCVSKGEHGKIKNSHEKLRSQF